MAPAPPAVGRATGSQSEAVGFPELILFSGTGPLLAEARAGGLESFIVDWEWRGKEERQRGADTEINREGPSDLLRLAAAGARRRFCRLNRSGPWTAEEIDLAIAAEATHLFLPMVETPEEVEACRRQVADRAALGILVETCAGVAAAAELATLPLDRVYVGLNDLAISRGSVNLFDAVVDGTVEGLASTFSGHRFGFGGLTVADGGRPIPCRLLMGEMVRLECSFTFLRRSFRRDVSGLDVGSVLAGMRALWERLGARSGGEVARDREAFARHVQGVRWEKTE